MIRCCVLLLVQSELDNVDEHRAETDGWGLVQKRTSREWFLGLGLGLELGLGLGC